MKKFLVALTLLSLGSSSAFAVQCSEKEYAPYFADGTRYIDTGIFTTNDKSKVAIDKKSLLYDKATGMIDFWVIKQVINHKQVGLLKAKQKFDTKQHKVTTITVTAYRCNGESLGSESGNGKWNDIVPGSVDDMLVEDLKNLLKIKQ